MRAWVAAVIGALVLCVAVPAAAQRREVEKLVSEAKSAFDDGNFEDAATLLQEAYDLEPVPFFIWNTARAFEKAGNWELAELNYLRYASLEITEEEQAQVTDRIARYKAARDIPAAVGKARASAELDTLRASNRQLRETTIAGKDDTSEPAAAGSGPGIWELAGWSGVGVGAVCLGAAATLHFASIGTVEEYNDAAASGRDRARYDALHDTLSTRVATSQVLLIGGFLIAAAGGTVLYFEYFDSPAQADPEARLVPVVGPGTGGFVLEGRF